MKKFNLILFSLFTINLIVAQTPYIEWAACLGGSNWDEAYSIILGPDSSYLVIGDTQSFDGDITGNHGAIDGWVVKLLPDGNMDWQQSYGGTGGENFRSGYATSDGGFIFLGFSTSTDGDVDTNYGGTDYWVVKTDAIGEIEWQKTYGGSATDLGISIQQTADGGYIIGGRSQSTDFDVSSHHGEDDTFDYWVIKIDGTGNIIWEKSFGGSDQDWGASITETVDGGYLCSGYSISTDGDIGAFLTSYDFWTIKLNSSGEILWTETYGGTDYEAAYSILETESSDILTCGYTESNDGDVTDVTHGLSDIWVIKTDSLGNLKWNKGYGGSGGDIGSSIIKVSDTTYLIAGFSGSGDHDLTNHYGDSGYGDFWVIKIDDNGVIIWQKSVGGSGADEAFSVVATPSGGAILAGWTTSTDYDVVGMHGGRDFWVVRIENDCEGIRYYADIDMDTYGDINNYIYSCTDTVGYVLNNLDCNDSNPEINPFSKDICNNIDDNCNGEIDENATFTLWFQDSDNDDFGNSEIDSLSCATVEGYIADSTDCDDTNELIYPGAPELLNGYDDNCNNLVDEGLTINEPLPYSIAIFPNPTTDILNIIIEGFEMSEGKILNVHGQLIAIIYISYNHFFLDVRNYPSGVYYLKINSSSSEITTTFIKE